MAYFILMNMVALSSAFLAVYRGMRFASFTDSLIAFLLFYFSQIVASELILGICGALFLPYVIFLNLCVFLTLWLLFRKRGASIPGAGIKDAFPRILEQKPSLLVASVLIGFGLLKLWINLVNPPFGWDDLNYHFTFAVEWLKNGNLVTPITVFDDPSPSYYPINGSLIYLWYMLPLKNVFLADLGQYPFFILAFLAVYSLSRKSGVERHYSFACAGLFLLIPNLFKQLRIAYLDVMVAALFLCALNFLFLLSRDLSRRNVFCFAAATGLLLGTKTVALPYTLLLLIPLFHYCVKREGRPFLFLAAFLAVIALGGFSYIRNFFETGNPLYPLELKFFGAQVFKGVMESSAYKAHLDPGDYSLAKLLFHEGLGLQTLLFVFPAVFLSLPLALAKSRKSLNFAFLYFLSLPFLLYLVYRFLIPLQNTRYIYPLLGAGMVSGFYACRLLGIPVRVMNILITLCVLASVPELARKQELVVSLLLSAALFFTLPYLAARVGFRNPRVNIALLFAGALALFALNNDYTKNEFSRYVKTQKYSGFWPEATSAWAWLNENTKGDNIAYAGRPVPFPLYGSNFKNNVYYVSVNKTDPPKLHSFKGSRYSWGYDFNSLHKSLEAEGNYRQRPSFDDWFANLIRRKTGYLFVYSLHQIKGVEFPVEDSWAGAHAQDFYPAFGNNTVRIYKVVK